MNIKLNELSNSHLKEWLRIKLASKWSERDINILCDVLQAEFQKTPSSNESIRTDREYFTKMLLKGKLQRGIAPDH
jgi:hypothetical protein